MTIRQALNNYQLRWQHWQSEADFSVSDKTAIVFFDIPLQRRMGDDNRRSTPFKPVIALIHDNNLVGCLYKNSDGKYLPGTFRLPLDENGNCKFTAEKLDPPEKKITINLRGTNTDFGGKAKGVNEVSIFLLEQGERKKIRRLKEITSANTKPDEGAVLARWTSKYQWKKDAVTIEPLTFEGGTKQLFVSPTIWMRPPTAGHILPRESELSNKKDNGFDNISSQYLSSNRPIEMQYRFELPIALNSVGGSIDWNQAARLVQQTFLIHGQTRTIDAHRSVGNDPAMALNPAASDRENYSGVRIVPSLCLWPAFRDGIALLVVHELVEEKESSKSSSLFEGYFRKLVKDYEAYIRKATTTHENSLNTAEEKKLFIEAVGSAHNHMVRRLGGYAKELMKHWYYAESAFEKLVDDVILLICHHELSLKLAKQIFDNMSNKPHIDRFDFESSPFWYQPNDIFMFKYLDFETDRALDFRPTYPAEDYRQIGTSPDFLVATSDKMFAVDSNLSIKLGNDEAIQDFLDLKNKLDEHWANYVSLKFSASFNQAIHSLSLDFLKWVKSPPEYCDKYFLANLREAEILSQSESATKSILASHSGDEQTFDSTIGMIAYCPVLSIDMARRLGNAEIGSEPNGLQILLRSINKTVIDISNFTNKEQSTLFSRLVGLDDAEITKFERLIDRVGQGLDNRALLAKDVDSLLIIYDELDR